jgi:hypothetical protein
MPVKETYPGMERMEEIFKAKEELRKKQAKLPFEEKIKIMVRLQHIAYNAAISMGRTPTKKPWPMEVV